MKIAICGSMQFARGMLDVAGKIKAAGYSIEVPKSIGDYAAGGKVVEDKWAKTEGDVIKGYFEKIKESDAVLIANFSKNGVINYIGGNSLIEMAFAHVLGKKIFLLNSIPEMSYSDEIKAMNPIVLDGDISKMYA